MAARSRRVEWSALTGIAPVVTLLPGWMAAVFVMWLPLAVWSTVSYWFFAAAALALGVLMFSRPVQRFVIMRLIGARSPDAHEAQRLAAAWVAVSRRAQRHPDSFVLAVIDDDSLNAFACGGHLVIVSSYAVRELDDDELRGVLAHELSHHLGLHTVALTVSQWMSLPIIALASLGTRIQHVAEAATTTFADRYPALRFVGRIVSATLHVVSWLLSLNVSLASALGTTFGRASELHADRRAAELGFGHELLKALRRVDAVERERSRRRAANRRRWASHPPAKLRINHLSSHLRRASPRWSGPR
ncbi:MAG: M48 family metalloprotease [Ilumatobacteraceae bacterium]